MSHKVPASCRVMDLLGVIMLMITAVCLSIALTTNEFVAQGVFLQRSLDAFALSVGAFTVSRVCELARLVLLSHVSELSLRSYFSHMFHRLARQ